MAIDFDDEFLDVGRRFQRLLSPVSAVVGIETKTHFPSVRDMDEILADGMPLLADKSSRVLSV
jgi:hypothetical protein